MNKLKTIRASEIDITSPAALEAMRAGESGYRRGVSAAYPAGKAILYIGAGLATSQVIVHLVRMKAGRPTRANVCGCVRTYVSTASVDWGVVGAPSQYPCKAMFLGKIGSFLAEIKRACPAEQHPKIKDSVDVVDIFENVRY